MAFILKDRVKENSTTTGTGNINLGGASATFNTFQSYLTNGDTTFYAIVHTSSGIDEWEVGIATWNTGNTLSRTTVLSGSSGTSAVNFSAGTKDVFMTLPADNILHLDANGDVDINGGTIDDAVIGATTANAAKVTTLETTSNADIGGYIDLEVLTSHASFREGRIWYDSIHKTINFYSDDQNVIHEVGLEEHQRVYNNTGSTINKGKPLYFSGNYTAGSIDVPTVALANATDVNKYNAQGLAASDIPNGSYGYCIIAGQLDGLDTSGLSAGTNFFVGLTDGAVQNSSPVYPNFPMCLGWVVNSDSTNGVLLVNQQNHSVNSFRVRTDAHIGDDLIVGGNLQVLGTTTSVSTADVTAGAPFYRANEGDSIGASGTNSSGVTGLDDAIFSGHFTGTTPTTYYVKIDSTGTPDTFAVSIDNFATTLSSGTAITGDDQLIHSADNIFINFGATTGHTLNDVWTGTASPTLVDTGFFSNRNTGSSGVGYTHVGFYYDVSEDKWVLLDEYDPTPSGSINLSDASTSYATLKAGLFEGNLQGNVTGDITGNASTADSLSTSRNIGGVAFNGTADINLAGVNVTGNQDTTGNADTATALETARTIQLSGDVTGSASFDGSANISITAAVQDDSHAHVISNVDGLQSALDAKVPTSRTITAGNGLTGGGDLTANRTLTVGSGSGITVNANDIAIDSSYTGFDGRYYTETEADSRFVNVTGDTMTGNLTVSKTDPLIRLYDSNNGTGTYPAIEFDTANNQGVAIELNEFDGELPVAGYGLVVKESSTNNQFPTTGTLSFNVLGEIYAGATSIGSLNKVFHDGYHPNADTLTTARTINGVSFNGSANITVADSTKLPLSGGTITGDLQAAGLYVGSSNTSYDFYNNGTSYLNGTTTIDANTSITGKLTLTGGDDDGTSPNPALQITNGTVYISHDEATIIFDEGQKMITTNDGNGNFSIIGGADDDGVHVDSVSGTSGLVRMTLDSDGTDGVIYHAVGPRRSGGSTANLTHALRIANNSTTGLTWITGSSTYPGSLTSTSSTIFHDNYHPNADTLTTARTINGVAFNGSANITIADNTKLPLSGGTMTGTLDLQSQKINFKSGAGGSTFGSSHYSMGVDIANGSWNSPNYSDLIIGYHTGIRLGASYTGIRFYNNSPTTDSNNTGNGNGGETLIMTVGGTQGSHVNIHNNLTVGNDATITGDLTASGGAGAITLNNSDIRSGQANPNWTGDPGTVGKIQYHSNRWYIVADQSSNRIVQFRRNNADKSYIDNNGDLQAGKAAGWITSRTLSLTGAVTGSVSWDGTGNASLSTSFNDNGPNYIDVATGNYGTVKVDDDRGVSGGWAGYAIRDDWVFMSNGAGEAGIYNDTDNEWAILCLRNADTRLYHNGLESMRTVGINGIRVGSPSNGSSDIYMSDSDEGDRRIHCNSNRIGFLNSSNAWSAYSEDSGNWIVEANLTAKNRLDVGTGTQSDAEIRIYKADNDVSDHIQFYNGGTRMGEIGCQDTSWLRINQVTAKNIYTPRYIRADGGFFVDGTAKGINGSGNFIGGTIAGASDYSTLLRSNANDTFTGQLTMGTQLALVAGNFGRGVFGLYSSTRYQHVWSMGTSYKTSDDGTSYGNMYGLTYTHTNIGTGTNQAISGLSHQLQHRQNGTLTAAIGSGIWTSGNVTAYSDIAVKTNLVKIPNALEKVCSLNGYTYERTDYVKDEEDPEAPEVLRQAGVVAQEVEKVLPEVVSGKDGNKAVAYGNMVSILIEAIKEQQEQINELKKRLK